MSLQNPTPTGGVIDKLAGKAKQAVGNLVGNDDLAAEGELQEEKAAAAKDAARLELEAEHAEREAEVAAEQERNRVEQLRVESELADRARDEQIERVASAEKAEAARLAARKEAVAADLERQDEAEVARHQVEAVAERIDGAQEVAEVEAEAQQAEAAAELLDAAQQNLDQQTREG